MCFNISSVGTLQSPVLSIAVAQFANKVSKTFLLINKVDQGITEESKKCEK